MITLKRIHNSVLISITLICFSCSGSKKENVNGVNQDNNQIEVVKDLEPLTCDSMYFDKTKNIIYFRFNNNAENSIDLLNETFEFKKNSEWERVPYKRENEETFILIGEGVGIPTGGDYIFKLFLNSYEMDSVANILRIVQPYHIRTHPVPPPNSAIDKKYLIHEFSIPD